MEENFSSFGEITGIYARQMQSLFQSTLRDIARGDLSTLEDSAQKMLHPALLQDWLEQQQQVLQEIISQPDLARRVQEDLTDQPRDDARENERDSCERSSCEKDSEETSGQQVYDKRFADPAWNSNPYLAMLRESYTLLRSNILDSLDKLEFSDHESEQRFRFLSRQFISAMAPSNFAASNPVVLREVLSSNGKCLSKGLQNLLDDIANSPSGLLKLAQSERGAFTLGQDLATSPGSVVLQNSQMQLIQYAAQTKTVFQTPLLLVPPFVNKYYVLDLEKRKSLVNWLTSRGYTVFMISWVNPTRNDSSIELGDYITEGIIPALAACRDITGTEKVNTAGYCTGGTLLAIALAMLKAEGDTVGQSCSFLATQTDFREPGDLGVYLGKDVIPFLKRHLRSRGVLDGSILAAGFNLLRENELYWPYIVEQYLLGRRPKPFALYHWSNDATNISASTLSAYVQKMYQENALTRAGGLSIKGVNIDLSQIELPAYFLALEKDHIVPWRSAYRSSGYFAGKNRFVLGDSGHVAGLINPAGSNKYGYRINERPAPDADAWLETSDYYAGSWWRDWTNWLKPYSGKRIAARAVGSARFPALEPAPGSYAKLVV